MPPGMVPGGSDKTRTAAVVDVGLVEDGEGTGRLGRSGGRDRVPFPSLEDLPSLPCLPLAMQIAEARVPLSRSDHDVLWGLSRALGPLQDSVHDSWRPPMSSRLRLSLDLLVVLAVNAGEVWG